MLKEQECAVCKKKYKNPQGALLRDIDPKAVALIKNDNSEITEESFICLSDILKYRINSIEEQLNSDSKEIEEINNKIIQSIRDEKFISEQLSESEQEKATIGERLADSIAKFGGSWKFIFIFIAIIVIWITINTIPIILNKQFDVYPFILLNLILSCLAAIQAPVIMMSQNRQESRDRQQSDNDYNINLKSEIEIRLLHDKLDYLLTKELKHLREIQSIQTSFLSDLHESIESLKNNMVK